NYENASAEKATEDYTKVIEELLRITGGESSIDTTVRLHNYAGSEEAINGFRDSDLGIEKVLSPEDRRLAYNLDEEQTSYLYQYDYFEHNGVEYIKTDVRLESLDSVDNFYKSFIEQSELNDILVVFTHEQYLIDSETQQKTNQLFEAFD